MTRAQMIVLCAALSSGCFGEEEPRADDHTYRPSSCVALSSECVSFCEHVHGRVWDMSNEDPDSFGKYMTSCTRREPLLCICEAPND